MTQLSENQQAILNYLLKSKDPATADDLVLKIGITKTAVKGHIDKLIDLGLLIYTDEKGAVGRPSRYYSLSEAGTEFFPRQYSWLSNQMLQQLSDTLSSNQLVDFMKKLADRVYQENKSVIEDAHPDRRLQNLKNLLNELGYKVTLKKHEKKETVVIEAFNCVYHNVAKSHTELCQFDLQLIRQGSQMEPVLESCIAKGGKSCRFCLYKK